MNKKFTRILSGVLSAVFIGQVMIYGDGSSQGIAHADTIEQIKKSLELSGNAEELKQQFENGINGLGEVDYFGSMENSTVMMKKASDSLPDIASDLTVTGSVQKGAAAGYTANDDI